MVRSTATVVWAGVLGGRRFSPAVAAAKRSVVVGAQVEMSSKEGSTTSWEEEFLQYYFVPRSVVAVGESLLGDAMGMLEKKNLHLHPPRRGSVLHQRRYTNDGETASNSCTQTDVDHACNAGKIGDTDRGFYAAMLRTHGQTATPHTAEQHRTPPYPSPKPESPTSPPV